MRRIVFASGKGGTGKTTMTALAAHFAAADGATLVLADCDVEAANLPIALQATDAVCKPFAGGAKAVIDPERCRGCAACVPVCRFDAIAPADDFYRTRAYAVDPWACEGCTACVPACSDGAIRMEPTQAGEACVATLRIGPLAFGRLAPGEDLSGKLVTEVRNTADAHAAEADAGLLLIDGPPGVGCPAIASITNTDLVVAVTEPTLSGEHDLLRLVTLARRLGVPVAVVLNKADLSAEGAARIRTRVAAEGLVLAGELPFDPELADTLGRLASGTATGILTGPGIVAARDAWRRIVATVGEPEVA